LVSALFKAESLSDRLGELVPDSPSTHCCHSGMLFSISKGIESSHMPFL